MIHELLRQGRGNAITGREIAMLLKMDIRTVTYWIEVERRAGHPICATMNGRNPGYYMAGNPEELKEYCTMLHHRAAELTLTQNILLATLKKMKEEATS